MKRTTRTYTIFSVVAILFVVGIAYAMAAGTMHMNDNDMHNGVQTTHHSQTFDGRNTGEPGAHTNTNNGEVHKDNATMHTSTPGINTHDAGMHTDNAKTGKDDKHY